MTTKQPAQGDIWLEKADAIPASAKQAPDNERGVVLACGCLRDAGGRESLCRERRAT